MHDNLSDVVILYVCSKLTYIFTCDFQKEEERFVREVDDEEEEEEPEETAMKDTVENDETDGINSLFTKKSVTIKYFSSLF